MKKWVMVALALPACCILFLFVGLGGQKPIVPRPETISMIQLIASPEKFDGKTVSVVGFLGVDPEDTRLYLSQDDYLHYIPGNGIWIDVNKDILRNVESIDLHYVLLVGVFKQHGLPSHYPGGTGDGGITDIRQCTPWLTPSERRSREPKDRRRQNPS